MKSALLLVLGLVACSYSKPQGFLEALGDVIGGAARDGARTLGDGNLINNIRNRIRNNPVLQERILQNRLNPCKGEAPQACRCTDGQSFQFSIEYDTNFCTGSNSVRPGRSSSAPPVSSGTGVRRDPPTTSSRSTSSLSDKIFCHTIEKYFVAILLKNLFFLIAGFVQHEYVIRFL